MAITTFAAIDVGSHETSLRIYEVSKKFGIRELDYVHHTARLGYETSAGIAKEALESGRSVMDLVLEKQLLTREELDELLLPENMIHSFLK